MEHKKAIYKDIKNLINPTIINKNWSRTGGSQQSSLHSVSSYLAMYAPALPEYFIEKYSKPGDLVFDPFSGRGTTALRARELNRRFVGSDLNPYALVLSRFKVSRLKKQTLINKTKYWENKFRLEKNFWKKEATKKQYVELTYYYHIDTLSQLLFIRENLGKKWNNGSMINNGLLAILCGIMHGKPRKDGTSIYLSVSMPNTISMSPNYVKNFVKKNNLKANSVNVFKKLRERIEQKYDDILEKKFDGKVYKHDANKPFNKMLNNKIDLLITSPPYLSVVNYTISNWIKLWLLGYERNKLNEDIKLTDKLNFVSYKKFMKKFLKNIHPKLKNGAKVCLVVGDVHGRKLIEEIWKDICSTVKYRFLEIYYDNSYLQERKVTNMLNNKQGKATRIEKVLVLEKVNEK